MSPKVVVLIFVFCCVGVSDQSLIADEIKCEDIPLCRAPDPGCTASFVYNSDGCPTGCTYHCPCGPLRLCPNSCPNGHKVDENGCQTCDCNECPPLPSCPHPPPGCRYLFTKDENDCIISCAPLDCGCQIQLCQPCPEGSGYVKDENGCDTCECEVKDCPPPPPCARPPPGCSYHLERDENDCIIGCGRLDCKCPEKHCPPCPHGYVQDENGCDTCDCKEKCPPPPPSCGSHKKGCIRHPINDENGCLIGYDVECKCPYLKCQYCPDGYVQNAQGCNTCKCKQKRRREYFTYLERRNCGRGRDRGRGLCDTIE